jgi:hypothetical protein
VEAGDITTGALVAGVVSLRNRPGMKNVAGDTDVPALTPPQPPAKNGSGSNNTSSQIYFQFNLTGLV